MKRIARLAPILALAAAALPAQPIRLGSIDAARFGGATWTLNGTDMEEARAKLLAAGNFGDSGTVGRAVVITDTAAAITSGLLNSLDVFFIGYLSDEHANAFTAAELNAFFEWVEDGGAMLVTCDSEDYDAVCARFGAPASGFGTNLVDASGPGFGHPALDGPFGAVRQFTAQGDIAAFPEGSPGVVVARSQDRAPMVIARRIGDGRVLLITDVDMLSDYTLTDYIDLPSPNDVLLGNAIAWLAGESTSGFCTPNETRLCLDGAPGDGRFSVTVDFETVLGGGFSGAALATPLAGLGARQGGLFTFFDEANPEMVLKILDGCIVNDHYWLYASAGTSVGMTITIVDNLLGGDPKVYVNPDLTPAPPLQDVNALPCD
jgi:hypothetical protein